MGPVQSKVISLLIFAPLILTPFAAAHATDYPPSVPNSNVFTTSAEAPKIDGPTGAFTQRIPLDIPPGRNGLQPDVSLQYNSQNTSDGIVGYGWSLSIPYIERLNKTGTQNLASATTTSATQYYSSSMEGEIVSDATTTPQNAAPSILDTLSVTTHQFVGIPTLSRIPSLREVKTSCSLSSGCAGIRICRLLKTEQRSTRLHTLQRARATRKIISLRHWQPRHQAHFPSAGRLRAISTTSFSRCKTRHKRHQWTSRVPLAAQLRV